MEIDQPQVETHNHVDPAGSRVRIAARSSTKNKNSEDGEAHAEFAMHKEKIKGIIGDSKKTHTAKM